jgi:hypothetical protein
MTNGFDEGGRRMLRTGARGWPGSCRHRVDVCARGAASRASVAAPLAAIVIGLVAAPQASAATFGYAKAGPRTDGGALAQAKRVNAYQLNEEGEVSQLSVYAVRGSKYERGKAQTLNAVIYSDSSGKPDALLAVGSEIRYGGTVGWLTLPFSPSVRLKAGRYWIGFISGAESGVMGFTWRQVAHSRQKNTNAYAAGPSNPFSSSGAIQTDSEEMSLYATYKPAPAKGFPSCVASCYYVSTTGSNTTGDGSEATPWQTIAYADEHAPTNAQVNVAPGTYNENATIDHTMAVVGEGFPVIHGITVKGQRVGGPITVATLKDVELADSTTQCLFVGGDEAAVLENDTLTRCAFEGIYVGTNAVIDQRSGVVLTENNLSPNPETQNSNGEQTSFEFGEFGLRWLAKEYFSIVPGNGVLSNAKIFVIFWGPEWSEAGSRNHEDLTQIESFISHWRESPWANLLTQYYNEADERMTSGPKFEVAYMDPSTPGENWFTPAEAEAEMRRAAEARGWSIDEPRDVFALIADEHGPPIGSRCNYHQDLPRLQGVVAEISTRRTGQHECGHATFYPRIERTEVPPLSHELAASLVKWISPVSNGEELDLGDVCQDAMWVGPGGQLVSSIYSDVSHECAGALPSEPPRPVSAQISLSDEIGGQQNTALREGEAVEAKARIFDPGAPETGVTFEYWTGSTWKAISNARVPAGGGTVAATVKAPSEAPFWIRVVGPKNGSYPAFFAPWHVR